MIREPCTAGSSARALRQPLLKLLWHHTGSNSALRYLSIACLGPVCDYEHCTLNQKVGLKRIQKTGLESNVFNGHASSARMAPVPSPMPKSCCRSDILKLFKVSD